MGPVRLVLISDTHLPHRGRDLPDEGQMVLFLAEFEGEAEAICPRGLLRRVLKRAESLGYGVNAAAEFEFFVFSETPDSVREKGYRNLKPITPGFFGYSMLRGSVWSELYHEILDTCEKMRMPIEGLHTETGPGVLEAAVELLELTVMAAQASNVPSVVTFAE